MLGNGNNTALPCKDVACPDLAIPGCRVVIPYGACCPHCGKHHMDGFFLSFLIKILLLLLLI